MLWLSNYRSVTVPSTLSMEAQLTVLSTTLLIKQIPSILQKKLNLTDLNSFPRVTKQESCTHLGDWAWNRVESESKRSIWSQLLAHKILVIPFVLVGRCLKKTINKWLQTQEHDVVFLRRTVWPRRNSCVRSQSLFRQWGISLC